MVVGRRRYTNLSENEKKKTRWLNIKKVLQNEKKYFLIIIRNYNFKNFDSL